MGELSLASLGLLTLAEAAARKGVSTRTVERWVKAGGLDHVVIGEGRTRRYLFRAADVDGYEPRGVGAPAGNQNARRRPAKAAKKGRPKK